MKENPVMGLSVAVVKNNKFIYSHSFGLKDAETNTPLTNDNIFRIASMSKAITSTAAMILYEQGKFNLDDPISKWIPAFKI